MINLNPPLGRQEPQEPANHPYQQNFAVPDGPQFFEPYVLIPVLQQEIPVLRILQNYYPMFYPVFHPAPFLMQPEQIHPFLPQAAVAPQGGLATEDVPARPPTPQPAQEYQSAFQAYSPPAPPQPRLLTNLQDLRRSRQAQLPSEDTTLGRRIDKRLQMVAHTVIQSASGQNFQLLNSLSTDENQYLGNILSELPQQADHDFKAAKKVVVGQGGYGKVRLARNLSNEQILAVKKMQANRAGHTELNNLMRLQRLPDIAEQQMVHLLDYAITFGKDNVEKCYLFQELMQSDLASPNNPKQLTKPHSVSKQLEIAVALLTPVVYLHENGLYHRDLKPENYLLDKNEEIKLADFGLLTNHKLPREIKGTRAYLAPEASTPEFAKADKTDAFALGVMLFSLIGFEHPMKAFNVCSRDRTNRALMDSTPFLQACNIAKDRNNDQQPELLTIALHLMHPFPSSRLAPAKALQMVQNL